MISIGIMRSRLIGVSLTSKSINEGVLSIQSIMVRHSGARVTATALDV
jgi:hypothetical protein